MALLTLTEFAKTYRLSRNTVRRLIAEEGLPVVRLTPHRVRISTAVFEEWAAARAQALTAQKGASTS
jgi:excisionase family DNA binding protein